MVTPADGVANQTFVGRSGTELHAQVLHLSVGAHNFTNGHLNRLTPNLTMQIYPLTGGISDGQVFPRKGGPCDFNGGCYYTRLCVKI